MEEDGIQCDGNDNDDKQSSSSPGPAARSEELLSEAELNVRAGPDWEGGFYLYFGARGLHGLTG